MNTKGKFVVIYAANNLGKSVQTQKLVEVLKSLNYSVVYLKYPIYDLEPTGPILNTLLRNPESIEPGKLDTLFTKYSWDYSDEYESLALEGKLPERILQKIFAQNRLDYETELVELLNENDIVVAEDYHGTGIAWGMTRDVPLKYLETINEKLLRPDLSILLDGKTRFLNGVESHHRNESAGDSIWEKNRDIHRELAKKYNWPIVNANQSIEKVHEDIMKIVTPMIQ